MTESVTVNVYVRGSYDFFLNDRYRMQHYLSNAAAITLDGMEPSSRTPTENATWTHSCQVSLAHKTARNRQFGDW